jgi:tRNA-(ms[2]io[6]A)-hydroxylase
MNLRQAIAELPLRSRTPLEWALGVLSDPISLLIDHAFLEKKAANNAMELMTRWPDDWTPGWVETMTGIARDEAAHLAQVARLLMKRGGRLSRGHKSPYSNALRSLVRSGSPNEIVDRLLVSALIELRSCERFALLADTSQDAELAGFYKALFASERGHYRVFLKLAYKVAARDEVKDRWERMLEWEARISGGAAGGRRNSLRGADSVRSTDLILVGFVA